MRGRDDVVAELLKQAAAQAWTRDQLTESIARRLKVSPLRAHRLAAGKRLTQIAEELRAIHRARFGADASLSHQNVSKWETGKDSPSARYRDLLCQLYATSSAKLGLEKDYSQSADPVLAEPVVINRREMMQAAGFAVTEGVLADLDSARRRTEYFMQKIQVVPASLPSLVNHVRELGYSIRFTEPQAFLQSAWRAYTALQAMWKQRQTSSTQRRLGREIAKLCGLIAIDLNAMGNADAADDWFRSGRSHARDADDHQLEAWLVVYEAMSHLWHRRRPGRTLELATEARDLAGRLPSAGAVLAALMQARAWARLDQPAEARAALGAAESTWSALNPEAAQDETVFGCYEQLLRMYQSDVMTIIGDYREAIEIQGRALALTPRAAGLDVDTALVYFDRAACLAGQHSLESATDLATRTYREVSPGFRHGATAQRAEQMVEIAVKAGARHLVAELEDLLRTR